MAKLLLTSAGFEYPKFIIEDVLNKGLDVEESLFNRGLTKHERVGSVKGG